MKHVEATRASQSSEKKRGKGKKIVRTPLADRILALMKDQGLKQCELAAKCCMSEKRVSRILRNDNGHEKSKGFKVTDEDIAAISLGLLLTLDEYEELKDLAFPERKIWREIFETGGGIDAANERLYNEGFAVFGEN